MEPKYLSLCPKCKTRLDYGTPKETMYCELCGAQVISKCPKCGKAIRSEQAKFCRDCGTNYLNPGKS
jgi:rRNA maturation endonuclease Nob1